MQRGQLLRDFSSEIELISPDAVMSQVRSKRFFPSEPGGYGIGLERVLGEHFRLVDDGLLIVWRGRTSLQSAGCCRGL
jgi:hypothetical protein